MRRPPVTDCRWTPLLPQSPARWPQSSRHYSARRPRQPRRRGCGGGKDRPSSKRRRRWRPCAAAAQRQTLWPLARPTSTASRSSPSGSLRWRRSLRSLPSPSSSRPQGRRSCSRALRAKAPPPTPAAYGRWWRRRRQQPRRRCLCWCRCPPTPHAPLLPFIGTRQQRGVRIPRGRVLPLRTTTCGSTATASGEGDAFHGPSNPAIRPLAERAYNSRGGRTQRHFVVGSHPPSAAAPPQLPNPRRSRADDRDIGLLRPSPRSHSPRVSFTRRMNAFGGLAVHPRTVTVAQ
jgi:hypothetical protein